MACKVKRNQHGYLALRVFFRGPSGEPLRSWEGTNLKDTPENRKHAEARAVLISREIKGGTFDYRKWFPKGNKAYLFEPVGENKLKTVEQYFEEWIKEKVPPLVRRSLERDYRQHFSTYILPRLRSYRMQDVTSSQVK